MEPILDRDDSEDAAASTADNLPEKTLLSDRTLAQLRQFHAEHETRVLTILLTDLIDSTRQQSDLGNLRAADLVRQHRRIFRDLLAHFDGQEVETAGDSFLAVFEAPSEGVRFALTFQYQMRAARRDEPQLPHVRLGLHQGEVVYERHSGGAKALDIYGQQISTATRLMDLGRGGQILCSREVFDNARLILRGRGLGDVGAIAWRNHGPYRFKGLEGALDVCEVGEEQHAPLQRPSERAKAWPADYSEEELGWRPAAGVTVPGTDWKLERKLGEGEFGEVWLALNTSSGEQQVYKFCFKRERVAWLKREARLLTELKRRLPGHPNIVTFGDVMARDDRPPYYITMEYVEGPSLEEWLRTNPPRRERLEIIAQVADGLDAVHGEGIYHRDVKPSNILLTRRRDGSLQAKLSDFGLGTADDPSVLKSAFASRIQGVAGAWAYNAPELQRGAMASPLSEVYSLGLTLYQVVVGDVSRLLFHGWEREIDSEVLRDDIGRCTDTDPFQRYDRAADLAHALRSHDERMAKRQLNRDRERTRQRARQALSIAVIVFAIAMVGFGGFAGWQWLEATRAHEATEDELYYSNILLAQRHIEKSQQDLARKALSQTPKSRRNWEWGHLVAQTHQYSHTLEGHADEVWSASFSPDGKRAVTASQDGTARIWDPRSGQQLFILEGHDKAVVRTSYNWNSRLVITASRDHTARIWDADDGLLIHTLDGHSAGVADARFSPDGMRVITASYDQTARIWDTATGRQLTVLSGHENTVVSARFSRDSRLVVTASRDKTARIWDAETGELLHILEGHEDAVSDARFSRDGDRVVTASYDQTARTWDTHTGDMLVEMTGHQGDLYSAEFDRDGQLVLTASKDHTARAWYAETGDLVHVFEGHTDAVQVARFAPDGQRIVTASRDHSARIWDAETGAELLALEGHGSLVWDARFSLDGQSVVTASRDHAAKIWETPTSSVTSVFEGAEGLPGDTRFGPDGLLFVVADQGSTATIGSAVDGQAIVHLYGHTDDIEQVRFSPDGRRVVTASRDGTARVWDAVSGQQVSVLSGHQDIVESGRFSADSRTIVTVSNDGTARLWDAASGEQLHVLAGHSDAILEARFSPDGSRVVTASYDQTARVWDTTTGATLHVLLGHEGGVLTARFSPSGRHIISASDDGTARIWGTESGEQILAIDGHDRAVLDARFSPDAGRVVTASYDDTAKVWDAETGALVFVLEGHKGDVLTARFSDDGKRIVTSSADATARLWDAETGRELLALSGHERPLRDARFSPDGRRIVTQADDQARVWLAAPWKMEDLPGDDSMIMESRLEAWSRDRRGEPAH